MGFLKDLSDDIFDKLNMSAEDKKQLVKDFAERSSKTKLERQRKVSNKLKGFQRMSDTAFDELTSQMLPVSRREITVKLTMTDGTTIVSNVYDKVSQQHYVQTHTGSIWFVDDDDCLNVDSEAFRRKYAEKLMNTT